MFAAFMIVSLPFFFRKEYQMSYFRARHFVLMNLHIFSQKTVGFLTFPGGIKMRHWTKIGQFLLIFLTQISFNLLVIKLSNICSEAWHCKGICCCCMSRVIKGEYFIYTGNETQKSRSMQK